MCACEIDIFLSLSLSHTHIHTYTHIHTHIHAYTHANKNADSGVGAGIDSYYEYCLKSYILLGDMEYLHRFNKVHIRTVHKCMCVIHYISAHTFTPYIEYSTLY